MYAIDPLITLMYFTVVALMCTHAEYNVFFPILFPEKSPFGGSLRTSLPFLNG